MRNSFFTRNLHQKTAGYQYILWLHVAHISSSDEFSVVKYKMVFSSLFTCNDHATNILQLISCSMVLNTEYQVHFISFGTVPSQKLCVVYKLEKSFGKISHTACCQCSSGLPVFVCRKRFHLLMDEGNSCDSKLVPYENNEK